MTPRQAKRSRTRRVFRSQVALTERDHDLLLFLGLVRYASSEQLAREFFPSADRARRRLRQLYDSGLTSVMMVTSTAPNLHALTRRGLAAASSYRPELAAELRLAGGINAAGVGHHVALTDCRLFAAAWGTRQGTPLMYWCSGVARRRQGLGLVGLRPDALAEFDRDGASVIVAVEVDAGSESLAVLGRKLERYRTLLETEVLSGVWLVLVGHERRRQGVVELVADSGLADRVAVLGHGQLLARPIREGPELADEPLRAAGPNQGSRPALEPAESRGVSTPSPAGAGLADG